MIRQQRSTRKGQSLVEFALIAPLFFTLIFGILEGSRLVWTNHTLSNATKEGARFTTVRGSGSIQADAPATAGSIETHMLSVSTGLNADNLQVSLNLLDGNMDDQSRFQIQSQYDFDFIVTSIFGLDGIQLQATSTDLFWRLPDN